MPKYLDLNKKIVVITGAAGFLAEAIITELLKNNSIVLGLDNDFVKLKNQLKNLKKRINNAKFFPIKCNVTNEKDVVKNVKMIKKKFKRIDILINNAATKTKKIKNFFNKFENYRYKDWKEIMNVNLDGAFLLSKEVSKVMIKQRSGNIISIASIQGVVGNDKRLYKGSKINGIQMSSPAVYSASKSALIGFTRYLSTYLGEYNIRANSLSPGGVKSKQNNTFIKKYSQKTSLNRMASSQEIAEATLFLCSNSSSYVTGENLIVDGGYTAW